MKINYNCVAKYKECIYQYGFWPMLFLLREYELLQNFEECQHIFLAFKLHHDPNIPTRLSKRAENFLRNACEIQCQHIKSTTPEIMFEYLTKNVDSYVWSIKESIFSFEKQCKIKTYGGNSWEAYKLGGMDDWNT